MNEIVVSDTCHTCSYLPEETARLPLRLPLEAVTPQELETRLAAGERRSGAFFYRTQCPTCRACEPLRVLVDEFSPGATHRRTLRKGDAELSLRIEPPSVDSERVRLYNAHKKGRELARSERDLDEGEYREFLVDSRCPSVELAYYLRDRLVCVAVADLAEKSLSAVYCYYDPALARMSLGSYSILKQWELCRKLQLSYLYLGLYIARSAAMSYKARFVPHERRIDGRWVRFDD